MTQAEDLDSVERLYATLDTSALLALLPLIDTLSERVRQEIERIGGPITSISEAQQHAALFESVTAGWVEAASEGSHPPEPGHTGTPDGGSPARRAGFPDSVTR